MRIKDIGKIKDPSDLKEISTNDVVELLDELRGIATKRGIELLGHGRREARRAIGAPGEGAVGSALVVGILMGAVVAAVVTLLITPLRGAEARRRLSQEVERVRERVPAARAEGNGRALYEPEPTPTPTA